MAASARLRADVRESIAERSEALAVQEESDRLRAARIKRSRRTRIARKAIARYDLFLAGTASSGSVAAVAELLQSQLSQNECSPCFIRFSSVSRTT